METTKQIIQAAQRLFGQFGFQKVSLEEIAKEAAVSKVTVYKYFRNKQDIFHSVVRHEAERLIQSIVEAVDRENNTPGKLKAHLLTKIHGNRDLANLYRVTRETYNGHWPYMADVTKELLDHEITVVRGILEEGNRSGELKAQNIDVTAQVMVISLKSLECSWTVEQPDLPVERIVDLLVDILLNGLKRQ